MGSVQVQAVSAVFYRCLPEWKIKERVMPTDMFFLMLGGRAGFQVGGRKYSVAPGDCLHLPCNIPQSAKGDPAAPLTVAAIHYHARAFGSVPLSALAGFPVKMQIREMAWMSALMEEGCREFFHQPAGWQEGLNAKVWELLLYVIRFHGLEGLHPPLAGEWRNLARLQPALRKMQENLPARKTMGELAQSCGYSEAQFRRVFQRAIGISPVAYLRERRMEEACRLLRETDLKIEEISDRVGYGDPAFFWSTFRKLMGQTPARFRRVAL